MQNMKISLPNEGKLNSMFIKKERNNSTSNSIGNLLSNSICNSVSNSQEPKSIVIHSANPQIQIQNTIQLFPEINFMTETK